MPFGTLLSNREYLQSYTVSGQTAWYLATLTPTGDATNKVPLESRVVSGSGKDTVGKEERVGTDNEKSRGVMGEMIE